MPAIRGARQEDKEAIRRVHGGHQGVVRRPFERAGFEAVEELTETIAPGVERASVRMFKELVS